MLSDFAPFVQNLKTIKFARRLGDQKIQSQKIIYVLAKHLLGGYASRQFALLSCSQSVCSVFCCCSYNVSCFSKPLNRSHKMLNQMLSESISEKLKCIHVDMLVEVSLYMYMYIPWPFFRRGNVFGWHSSSKTLLHKHYYTCTLRQSQLGQLR